MSEGGGVEAAERKGGRGRGALGREASSRLLLLRRKQTQVGIGAAQRFFGLGFMPNLYLQLSPFYLQGQKSRETKRAKAQASYISPAKTEAAKGAEEQKRKSGPKKKAAVGGGGATVRKRAHEETE